MRRSFRKKISEAEKILEHEREDLLRMVTNDGIDDFGSPRDFMFIREEDAKYRIKSLGLPEDLLKYYMNKICEIYGPYSDDIPDKKRRYYDNDIYLGM